MKGALANRSPVVVGIDIYNSFEGLSGPNSVYNIATGDVLGGHAVTIVGYDDTRFGGAFRIINSWGRAWGDGGFFWMPYDFVSTVLQQAYVLQDGPNTNPINPPKPPTGDLPNFQIVSWDADFDPMPRGQGHLRYKVANTGTAVAPAGAYVNLMLSPDPQISSDDVYVVYEQIPFDLAPGESAYRDGSNPIGFTFPDTLQSGNYYMALWVDDLQAVTESNEDDNVSLGSSQVTIHNDLPDLAVDWWYATWDFDGVGTNGALVYEVSNNGTTEAPPGWDINLVLSPNETIGDGDEIYLAYDRMSSPLPAGYVVYRDESAPKSFSLDVDAFGNRVPSGTYFMALWVDDLDKVAESDELNNTSLSWGRIQLGGSGIQPQAARSTAAHMDASTFYNGKKLPGAPMLVKKVQIGEGPNGGTEIHVLEENAEAIRTKPRDPGLFSKRAQAGDVVVFPIERSTAMP